MPRPPRDIAARRFHHIFNRGNRRQVIFHKPGDYKAFIRILVEAVKRFEQKLIAFCVMNNHFHIVLRTDEKVSISTYMHWVTSTHVRRYQRHYDIVGSGHIYQRRFANKVCRSERSLLSLIRYVEANPLKAGLVKRAEDWRWSSLWLRLHGDPDGLLEQCPIELPPNWADYINKTTPQKDKPPGRKKPPSA
jgi:REP-associated tyrosine transposase